jgi:hypothetical protein
LARNSNGRFDRRTILTIPVSPVLPRPYNHERVTTSFRLDEDLVLHVDAKAATQAKGGHEEIVDCASRLPPRRICNGIELVRTVKSDAR